MYLYALFIYLYVDPTISVSLYLLSKLRHSVRHDPIIGTSVFLSDLWDTISRSLTFLPTFSGSASSAGGEPEAEGRAG